MGRSNLYNATQCLDTAGHGNQESGLLPEWRRSNWALSQPHLEQLENLSGQHRGRDGVSDPASQPAQARTLTTPLTGHQSEPSPPPLTSCSAAVDSTLMLTAVSVSADGL